MAPVSVRNTISSRVGQWARRPLIFWTCRWPVPGHDAHIDSGSAISVYLCCMPMQVLMPASDAFLLLFARDDRPQRSEPHYIEDCRVTEYSFRPTLNEARMTVISINMHLPQHTMQIYSSTSSRHPSQMYATSYPPIRLTSRRERSLIYGIHPLMYGIHP